MHVAESKFSNLVIEYPGEIETEFENTNHEKKWRSKISWQQIEIKKG